MPKSTCKSTYLGKGDTYYTLDTLKNQAYKYQSQTSKIAPLLKGYNLRQTVQNVFEFLHDHLQYKQDGFEQHISSPQCTWHKRTEGIDCKSYSLFASTILLNLGIHHSFRKIRLQAHNPEFNHVYIVIPTDQKTKKLDTYLIIDATIHINKESPFVEKKDIQMLAQMPHYGLNGVNGAVPLNDTRVAVNNFRYFLNELIENGINRDVVIDLRNFMTLKLQNGIDPIVRFDDAGLWVDDRYFSFASGLNGWGAIAKGAVSVLGSLGGKKGQNGKSGGFSGAIGKVTQFIDVKKIVGGFTNIFKNGFDFSCFNSSYNQSKAANDVKVDLPFIVKESGIQDGDFSEKSINYFSNLVDNYIKDSQNGTQSKFAKCTRKGHQLRLDAAKKLRKTVFDNIESNQDIEIKLLGERPSNGHVMLPGYAKGRKFGLHYPVRYYSVTKKSTPIFTTNKRGFSTNGNQNYTPQNNGQGQNNRPNTAGFGGGSMGLIAVAAIGALILLKK